MSHIRPDPEALLAQASREDSGRARGHLKIFFGMCPGVGKTYTMLEAARQKAMEGVDVVAGYVEPHARPETEAILIGLEVMARKSIPYRGVTLEEFDLDAALKRKPQLILVDELAHTNAPGARHAKRMQDIQELLAAGIDVFTTLNVQHLESMNDVIAQITGVIVRETVPDSILDDADDVELVDLPPDDLLERLKEGRVYIPEQARQAAQGFFRRENLIALRELALRVTADRVGAQVQVQHAGKGATHPWATGERLLVCVGPSPLSARVIRVARRIAAAQHCYWVAAWVETSSMSRAALLQARRNLRLAERLGAETAELAGDHPVDELLAYARRNNISRIVIGKPSLSRWRELLRGSIVDELIRRSGEIDVHVIKGDVESGFESPAPSVKAAVIPTDYAKALATLAVCTLVAWPLSPYFSPTNLAMIFLAGTVHVALRLGTGPAVMASLIAPLTFNFFFTQPYFSFAITDTQYLLTFFVLLSVSLIISGLSARVRRQTEAARTRYLRTTALYFMSRQMAVSSDSQVMIDFAARHLSDVFGCPAAVLIPAAGGTLAAAAHHGDFPITVTNEITAAAWVLQNQKWAGRGTDTLPACQALYVPLVAADKSIGVIGLKLGDENAMTDPDQQHLLETFASQVSLALQRAKLVEQAQAAQLQIESERLRNSLLSSVSHDLRTPLATITGASSLLVEEQQSLTPEVRRELAQSIYEESDRLNRLVSNLLDVTRLESGALQLNREWQPLEEVVGVVLRRLETKLASHKLQLHIPPDLPLVPIDCLLIQQVLLNLLENAIKYTPQGTQIDLRATGTPEGVFVEVADRGPGLREGDCEQVFEKFYRSPARPSMSGVGLGLTVCRGIVQAHGGQIWAENRTGGGASFRFTLPIVGEPPASPPVEATTIQARTA
jgi:two-component system sensor histidine kinase KdpD